MKCPYCEKERTEISCYGSIDNDFDYACVICNLEFVNWLEDKEKHTSYENDNLRKEVKRAIEQDRLNNEVEWKSHLKTIAERAEIFQPELKKGNKNEQDQRAES